MSTKTPKQASGTEIEKDFQFLKPVSAESQSIDMYLYDDIGKDYGGIDAEQFAWELRWASQYYKKINVHINSAGGRVFDGWSIYAAIQNVNLNTKGVTVDTYCDGICASIAAIIMLSGKKVYMNDYAKVMIHEAYYAGASEDMLTENQKKLLAEINESTLQILTKRTGQTAEVLLDMLKKETYFNAQKAKEMGFVDEVIVTPAKNPILQASQNAEIKDLKLLMAIYQDVCKVPQMQEIPIVEVPTKVTDQATQNTDTANTHTKTPTKKNMSANTENSDFVAEIMQLLEVTEKSEIKPKIGQLKASLIKNELFENEVLTLREQRDTYKEMLDKQSVQLATTLIEENVKIGKIRPYQKDKLFEMAKNDYESAKKFIDEMNGHPNLSQKVKHEDNTSNWDFTQWMRQDYAGLMKMKEDNIIAYKTLYENHYKTSYPEK
jgi:ATP-dependent protease ClpP protease subunit